MEMRRSLGWMVVGGALLAFAPVVGCKDEKKDDSKSEKSEKSEKDKDKKDKDKGDDDDGDKKTKKKGKDGDGDKPSKGGAKYTTGDVLKHMPKSCKQGRMYLNVGLLLKNEAVEKSAEALEDKLAAASKNKKKSEAASKALKALKKAGIDPARDVKEVAVCAEDKGDPVVAIGGDFAGKDPIEAMKKAVEEAGDKEVDVKEIEGVKALKDGSKYVVNVVPNVLVFTKDKESIADLKKETDPDAKWDHADDRILSFDIAVKKNESVTGTITEKGSDLDFKVTMDMKGAGDDPDKVKKQFEAMAAKLEAKLEKGPFKKIADDIGKTKFTIADDKLTVTLTIPASDLGDAIKAAATASDEDLNKATDL